MRSGQQDTFIVAPWVVDDEKKALILCLMGFLKNPSGGVWEVELWLAKTWGRKPITIKLLENDIVLMQVSSEVEIEEILRCAESSSPFITLQRWMEVIGAQPRPKWTRFRGVPLQAWREGVFRLLGDVLGRTLEVDLCTTSKEVPTHGRVKVLMGKAGRLPKEIPLSIGDLQVSVLVEEEHEDPNEMIFPSSISK